ncbi:hypothetical protein [Winogradskyella haliclonae]|uniref:TerB family tellurite resistance protein n=1 Tax=Winogradskyella haliclonae TaxID=2048558 RepID=A0ABQ2BWY6_9FLAO|nr:hypothetical protein [Winogradskyella haliclonae]GGI56987.1 hypothetical protein GCM10011444_12960 [Winogradskyella haliclonae]
MSETSKYFAAFASIMKITLREGNSSIDEKRILQEFGKKLGISSSEYFELLDSYDSFDITPVTTRNERLKAFYQIINVIFTNDYQNTNKNEWLERIGVAIGFSSINIKYIVLKSLDLFKSNEPLTESIYIDEINNMNK